MVETKANYIHKRLKNIRKLSKKNYMEGKNKFYPKDINKIVKNYGGNIKQLLSIKAINKVVKNHARQKKQPISQQCQKPC